MKKNYFITQITLFVCSIAFFNVTIKAQPIAHPPLQKDTKKSADSLSSVVKYKIKSTTVLRYSTNDSTLNNAKLESKEKTIYSHDGEMMETTSENSKGKMLNKYENKYDSRNNVIQSISYDSLNKITSESKFYYDDKNRVIESSSSMPLSTYTGKQEDAGKSLTYTYRNKYDVNGNVVETTEDSSGVIVSRTASTFDNKKHMIRYELYSHAILQSTETMVYDAKGGYTETVEYYWSASKTQCSPNKNRTVSKFDNKDNVVSSLSISDESGVVSTDKTTNEYKYYDATKLLSLKTTTESNSEGYSSKSISSTIYTYDKNGNVTETASKYGGGGGNYTMKYKYNSANSVIEETIYNGTCMDKPSSIGTYTYYADGKTLKESVSRSYDYPSKTIDKYDDHALLIETILTSEGGSTHNVYNYEFW
jgi:hypothetical protein